MKKLILVLAVMFTALTGAKAQQFPVIADDPEVRKGVLPNGMTYYVRYNDEPAGQADFYIYHDVGAVQEEDSQIGLAHFLEHMAFNGTKNLPGKQLMNWLETIGVKFGQNLNAMTGQDRTIYLVSSVPVSREGIIDSALLILHDWSHFISLIPEEIDKERGVIREELRGGNSAGRRIFEKQMPYIYGEDTRYGNRNVIGEDEHLKTFSYQEIIDFYNRWYRPDLQAIVVVGDINPDAVVAKIEALMADIPAPENAPEKEIITITPNDEPLIKVLSDPELTSTNLEVYIGRDALPKEYNNTMLSVMYDYIANYITTVLNERLNAIEEKPGAPFTSANAYNFNLIPTADVFGVDAAITGTNVAAALEIVYTEMQRMARYGLTVAEFERAKANFERRAQQTYDGSGDRRNNYYVNEYVSNFRSNSPMPDAETEYNTAKQVLDQITIEAVNQMIPRYINLENQKIFVTTPDKDLAAMPTEEAIGEILAKINGAEIEAPQEEISNIPLISPETKLNGSKVAKTEQGQFGETIWTLGNGMRIIVKPTDFKKDEIRTTVYSFGGKSLVGDDLIVAADALDGYFAQAGLAQFTPTELRKQLAGKAVSYNFSLSDYLTSFSGNTSPKDLETLFQLLYLNFTAQRWDADAYGVMIEKMTNQLKDMEANPQFMLIKNLYKTMYAGNVRQELMTADKIGEITFERLQQIWKAVSSNPADFTVEIVGNVNLDELKPLVEKYVGSLKTGKNNSKWIDRNVRLAQGEVLNRFKQQMETPNVSIVYIFNGNLDYTLKNTLVVDAFGQILRTKYTESIREELGGTYSPQAAAGMMDIPTESYLVQAIVMTNEELSDKVEELIVKGIEDMANEGVSVEDLDKIKQFMLKQYADNVKTNSYWAGVMRNFYLMNRNFHDGYEAAVNALSTDDIKEFAQKIMADKNITRVIMDGVKAEAVKDIDLE